MKLVIEMSSIMKAIFINKKVELFNKIKRRQLPIAVFFKEKVFKNKFLGVYRFLWGFLTLSIIHHMTNNAEQTL